uniref:NADH-ubiquinone oxidoreductase chain 2 n=1 Tax=Tigriopus californicus TaxID=6832 RepID=A2T4Y0_TIGCA|nr:NADH dehydrogenase subunit 2 [Tigriopus californicus]ABI33092.1 NADH dehydrogenase subunit 2 [Tigriopus californicus]
MMKNFISFSGVGLLFLGLLGGLGGVDLFQYWIFLELNLAGFIVYACVEDSFKLKGGVFEYFLIQSFYSSFLLMVLLHFPLLYQVAYSVTVSILLIKLGVAPFHGWLISLFPQFSWECILMLSITQKVLPLYGISVLRSFLGVWMFGLIMISVILSVLISVSFSFNERMLGKVLGFSSLFNQGWLLSSTTDLSLLMFFLILYGVSLGIFVWWGKSNSLKVTSMSGSSGSPAIAAGLFLGLASLAGLPPFGLFFCKAHVLGLLLSESFFMGVFLALSSVSMLLIYSRIFMSEISGGWKLRGYGGQGSGLSMMVSMLGFSSFMFI